MNAIKSRKWIIFAASAAAVVVIVAIFTNPDQASHFKAMKETIALRKSVDVSSVNIWLRVNYNNYVVFSTTSAGKMTFTYGYFGQVKTTNDISFFE